MSEPRLSVITPLYKPVIRELKDCLRSAKGPGIEHILVLDGASNVHNLKKLQKVVRSYGAKLYVLDDQAGISEASNVAASHASGEFLVFLDQDDFLEENWWAPLLLTIEDADFVYSDSFHANSSGHATSLQRKPSWSPIRLIFSMYAVHFMAIRKSVFDEVSGFRSQYDGSQDHDIALRISRMTDRFKHIPIPLYSWRQSAASTLSNPTNKSWAYDAGAAAAQDHLQQFDAASKAERIEDFHPGGIRGVFAERKEPVSIVVPTAFGADKSGSLWVEKLFHSLKPFLRPELGDEIVLVTGKEKDKNFIARARGEFPIDVVRAKDDKKFNFSRRCNIGFSVASNKHVLLLNDDVEFGSENPFNSLFGLLNLPNVGLVGGLLAFPDYSIQHGGHAFIKGLPVHTGYQGRSREVGLFDLIVDREAVGVTGALMFQLKSTWQTVGGFTTSLPLSFNDVDYCQKIRSLGMSIVQANSVKAIHHESVTREAIVESWEIGFMVERWSDIMASDGFATPYR